MFLSLGWSKTLNTYYGGFEINYNIDQTYKKSYLTLKRNVVGTQKNRLSETIHLSTQNIGFDWVIREILGENSQYTAPFLVIIMRICSVFGCICSD